MVLDLGCGTGTLLETLLTQRPEARYVGVDPDPQVLGIASRKLRRHASVELLTGYGDHLPVTDQAFDVVVSTLTFHHLTDSAKRSTLAEVRRVLRPAGRFVLVDFGRPTSRAAKVLLTVGSLFDGRANMRANLRQHVRAGTQHLPQLHENGTEGDQTLHQTGRRAVARRVAAEPARTAVLTNTRSTDTNLTMLLVPVGWCDVGVVASFTPAPISGC